MSYLRVPLGAVGTMVAVLLSSAAFWQASPKSLRHAGTIDLPGRGGFVDYLVIAPTGHTLYAGDAAGNALVVVGSGPEQGIPGRY